jgi:predicted SAM-dependent methyltransferase
MKIQVDADLREELVEFLERADCTVQIEDDGTLVVTVPDAFGEDQARLEVDLYLKAWQASHPDVETHLLGRPPSGVEDEAETAD